IHFHVGGGIHQCGIRSSLVGSELDPCFYLRPQRYVLGQILPGILAATASSQRADFRDLKWQGGVNVDVTASGVVEVERLLCTVSLPDSTEVQRVRRVGWSEGQLAFSADRARETSTFRRCTGDAG